MPITGEQRPTAQPSWHSTVIQLTYGTLWVRANDTVRELRSLGVGRSDRVAVVLPDGPETALAIIAVAAGAVCVPLNPGFTADEWHRYLADLRVAALLTRADMDTASRGAAHTLGIPVIDLSPRPDEGAGAFSLVGSVPSRAVRSGLAAGGADDAFILLTSGSTSRPKMVPLTQAGVCLSAHNVGATLALGSQDRLLNVLPLFHAHGLISGLLAALAAGSSVVCTPRIRSRRLLRLADGVSADLVHGGSDNPSGVVVRGESSQTRHPAALVASHPLGLFVAAVRRGQRTGIAVWCPGDRYLRHDGSRFPDCREPSGTTQAWFGWQVRRVPRSRSWTKGADGCQPANGERSRCGALPSPGDTMTMPQPTKPHFGMAGFEPATSDTWIATDISSLLGGSKTSSTGEVKRSRPATSKRPC